MRVSAHKLRRRSQAGYSLLLAVFMVATMLIMAAAAAPNLLTQGRREKETEMIWRGEQYERAIGLYYRKFGRYPTKVDDLTKQTNGVRFLRQAYKDPTNKEDGTWRFIYLGPNGQLIGSTRNVSLLQGLLSQNAPSVLGSGSLNAPPPPPQNANGDSSGTSNSQQQGTQQQVTQPGVQQQGTTAPGGSGLGILGSPTGGGPQSLTGDVIGGNIIGVGSKTKEPSLRVYLKGDTYDQWEFVWNPLQQAVIPGQQAPVNQNPGSSQPQTGQPGPFGLSSPRNIPLSQAPMPPATFPTTPAQ